MRWVRPAAALLGVALLASVARAEEELFLPVYCCIRVRHTIFAPVDPLAAVLLLAPFLLFAFACIQLSDGKFASARRLGRVCLAAGSIWMALGFIQGWREGWNPLDEQLPEDEDSRLMMVAGGVLVAGSYLLIRITHGREEAAAEALEERRIARREAVPGAAASSRATRAAAGRAARVRGLRARWT